MPPVSDVSLTTIDDVHPLHDLTKDQDLKRQGSALFDLLFAKDSDTATFAVIDAALVPNLPEMLDASDCPHKSFFKGATLAELGPAGPWLVQLAPEAQLTENLFTKGNAPWHLWDSGAFVIVQSTRDFQSLWSHLRKFHRIRDEHGKWYYFRFWDNETFETLASAPHDAAPWRADLLRAARFAVPKRGKAGTWILAGDLNATEDTKTYTRVVLTDTLRTMFDEQIQRRREAEDIEAVKIAVPAAQDDRLRWMRGWLMERGISNRDQLRTAMRVLENRFPGPDTQWPDPVVQLLSDTAKGAGVRVWLLENNRT